MSKTAKTQKSSYKVKAKVAIVMMVDEGWDTDINDIVVVTFPSTLEARAFLRSKKFLENQAGEWENSSSSDLVFARIVEKEVEWI